MQAIARAALAETETPQICVCRPDESYCGAWDCRHDPARSASLSDKEGTT